MLRRQEIFYAGYGANCDPAMIEAIIGRRPNIIGRVAILEVELCVQGIDQAPATVIANAPVDVPVRELLQQTWGDASGFETYAVRRRGDSTVAGTLFRLTEQDRALVAEWEMIDYGWYDDMVVRAVGANGQTVSAVTEGFERGQAVARLVDGNRYSTYLNSPAQMHEIARQTREEFLKNQSN